MEYFSSDKHNRPRFEHIDHKPPKKKEPEGFCKTHTVGHPQAQCKCEYKVDFHCDHKPAALFVSSSRTQHIHCCDKPQYVTFDRCHIDKCFYVSPCTTKVFAEETGLYQINVSLQVSLPLGEDFNCYDGRYNFRTFLAINDCPLEESSQVEYLQHGLKTTLVNQYMAFLQCGECVSVLISSNHPKAQIQALCTCEEEPFVPSAKLIMVKV